MKMPIGFVERPPSPATNASDSKSVAESLTSENSLQINSPRPQMDVACVLDLHQSEHLSHRKKALEELKIACNQINAQLHHITVESNNCHIIIHVNRFKRKFIIIIIIFSV